MDGVILVDDVTRLWAHYNESKTVGVRMQSIRSKNRSYNRQKSDYSFYCVSGVWSKRC